MKRLVLLLSLLLMLVSCYRYIPFDQETTPLESKKKYKITFREGRTKKVYFSHRTDSLFYFFPTSEDRQYGKTSFFKAEEIVEIKRQKFSFLKTTGFLAALLLSISAVLVSSGGLGYSISVL